MNRFLGFIFACLALLTQIASGPLPSDARICIPLPAASACCCDDAGDAEAIPTDNCPCHRGCDRCICVTPPDSRTTVTAGPRTRFDQAAPVLAMVYGIIPPERLPVLARMWEVRTNPSPPDIPIVRTVRLVL